MILNLYSYYLIGNKKSFGFILGLVACVIGIILFYEMASMVIMYISFAILNLKGYLKWKTNKI